MMLMGFVASTVTVALLYAGAAKLRLRLRLAFWRSDPPQIKRLKNALLAYALMNVRRRDVALSPLCFDGFDGTQLPALDTSRPLYESCMSYITDMCEIRRCPYLHSIWLEQELDAVERYLSINLDTAGKVESFFKDFVQWKEREMHNAYEMSKRYEPVESSLSSDTSSRPLVPSEKEDTFTDDEGEGEYSDMSDDDFPQQGNK
jgi:hypothetical protein